jgi:hypothetical protein
MRQKNPQAWLLLLRPAAENPRSTLPEQVSESAEIRIRDPIGVPRCSPQSGRPYKSLTEADRAKTENEERIANSFFFKSADDLPDE